MRISVIIPSHNRRESLEKAVKSLLNQTYPKKEYEIIVVSDSHDGSEEMIKELTKRSRIKIKFFRKQSDGPSQKRNVGIGHAAGRVVAFLDDDCIAQPEWLSNLEKKFGKDTGAVEGRTVTKESVGPFSHYIRNETGGQYMTCNMAYRKDLISRYGGFDESFTTPVTINREDSDIAFTLIENGYRIEFAKDAVVRHPHVKTSFLNRLKKKKEFFVDPLLFKKHKKLYSKRIKFPFEMFTPFYLLFTILTLFFPYFFAGIILTSVAELVHRKWHASPAEFIKFIALQIAGSFVVVIFYLYGCTVFRVNPARPIIHI